MQSYSHKMGCRFQKHFPKWKNELHWDLSLATFPMQLGVRSAWMYMCVIEILMTIPIHAPHASIWILLSEHMSGKSAPSNRIQAQMMSFYMELTCHLSDSPHQGLKQWGYTHTGFLVLLGEE